MKNLLAILLISAATAGCLVRVSSDELPGRWQMRRDSDDQLLQLDSNGTFSHVLVSDGTRKTATGEWELIGISRAPRVLLKYKRDFGGHRSGASLNIVRGWAGDLQLSNDPDRQSVFKRADAK